MVTPLQRGKCQWGLAPRPRPDYRPGKRRNRGSPAGWRPAGGIGLAALQPGHIRHRETTTSAFSLRGRNAGGSGDVNLRPGQTRGCSRLMVTRRQVSAHHSIRMRASPGVATGSVSCAGYRFMLVRVVNLPDGSRKGTTLFLARKLVSDKDSRVEQLDFG